MKQFLGLNSKFLSQPQTLQTDMNAQAKGRDIAHDDNCWSKSEKDNVPMSKEQCQSWGKVFVEHILWEFVTHVYSDIFYW